MSEKSYKRQLAIIWTVIIIAIVLIIGATVAIILSSGGTQQVEKNETFVTVENYVGKKYDEVHTDGLKFESVEVFSEEEKGVVIQQSVAEGTSVKKGTTIVVNVSKGNSEVVVPSIIGKTEDEAVKALRDNGFEVTVRYILNYNDGDVGTVKSCSPSVGEKVSFGSKVTISVYGDDLMVTTTTTTRPTSSTENTETTVPTTVPTTTLPTTAPTTEPVTSDPTVDSGAQE
ncbi:MAG: PASTA domain-containing protein [Clostridia bacterium]|nr:PASTA domain-containing protein [Clostridia bacterium]